MGNIERSDAEIDVLSDLLDQAREERDYWKALAKSWGDEKDRLTTNHRGAVEALREFQDAYVREFGMGHGSDFVIRHVQTITDRLGGQ